MNNMQRKSVAIFLALAALMALTRFNHFGSAVTLPDASYAVFFLGGLYLARFARAPMMAFVALIFEAGLIDYYATAVQGVSDWCMSPAYWFLIPTYGSLWLVGRWIARRLLSKDQTLEGKALIELSLAAWVASSFAFVFSNATFYLFSGRYGEMSVVEYTSRVAPYYVSYVSVALLYIACMIALQMVADIIDKQNAHSH